MGSNQYQLNSDAEDCKRENVQNHLIALLLGGLELLECRFAR